MPLEHQSCALWCGRMCYSCPQVDVICSERLSLFQSGKLRSDLWWPVFMDVHGAWSGYDISARWWFRGLEEETILHQRAWLQCGLDLPNFSESRLQWWLWRARSFNPSGRWFRQVLWFLVVLDSLFFSIVFSSCCLHFVYFFLWCYFSKLPGCFSPEGRGRWGLFISAFCQIA